MRPVGSRAKASWQVSWEAGTEEGRDSEPDHTIPDASITNYYHFLFFFYSPMRKVLAVASVGTEHKELVFKELKKIFRRIKISLDVLLQEEAAHSRTTLIENGNVFSSYPYITLTIPNY